MPTDHGVLPGPPLAEQTHLMEDALGAGALNKYVHHTGSAVFACPPGVRPGQHWGGGLFT